MTGTGNRGLLNDIGRIINFMRWNIERLERLLSERDDTKVQVELDCLRRQMDELELFISRLR
jgi:hypothetical protein